jgi:hypothetical protein
VIPTNAPQTQWVLLATDNLRKYPRGLVKTCEDMLR